MCELFWILLEFTILDQKLNSVIESTWVCFHLTVLLKASVSIHRGVYSCWVFHVLCVIVHHILVWIVLSKSLVAATTRVIERCYHELLLFCFHLSLLFLGWTVDGILLLDWVLFLLLSAVLTVLFACGDLSSWWFSLMAFIESRICSRNISTVIYYHWGQEGAVSLELGISVATFVDSTLTMTESQFTLIFDRRWYNFVLKLWRLGEWLGFQGLLMILERCLSSFKSRGEIHISWDDTSIEQAKHSIIDIIFSNRWWISKRIISEVLR